MELDGSILKTEEKLELERQARDQAIRNRHSMDWEKLSKMDDSIKELEAGLERLKSYEQEFFTEVEVEEPAVKPAGV